MALAAVMVLSVFATPAAAASATSAADTIVNADNVGDGGEQVTATSTISFQSPSDDNPSVGDTITVQLTSGNLEEGDVEIDSASVDSVDPDGTAGEVTGVEVKSVRDGNVFTGTQDTVIVEITSVDTSGGTDVSDDSFDLTTTYTINSQAAENAGASTFTGTGIIGITADTVGGSANNLAGTNLVNLEIEPGPSPDKLQVTGVADIAHDGTATVTVKAVDQFGAVIEPENIAGVSDLANAQSTYSDISNVNVNLTSVPNDVEDFNTSGTLALGSGASGTAQWDVAIGSGAGDINTAPDGTAYVGNFEVQASDGDGAISASSAQSMDIKPGAVAASFENSTYDADDRPTNPNETALDVNITDGAGTNLEVAELELSLTAAVTSGNYQGSTANGTLTGPSIADTNGDAITSITVDGSTAQNIVITDNLNDADSSAFTFSSTDAADYTLTVTEPVTSSSAAPSVTVSPGAADTLDLTVSDTTFDNGKTDFVSPTVTIKDAHDNQVDGTSRYSSSDTDLTFTLKTPDGDNYNAPATKTLTGVTGSPATIGDSDGGSPDIGAGVGTFTLEVQQDSGKLANDVDSETFTVYPASVTVSETSGGNVDAGTANTIDLTLQDDGTNGPVNNVSSFQVDLRLDTETLQSGADIASSSDLKVEIANEGQLNASGSQQDVTVTVESGSPSVDFNSTTAGTFGLEAEVDTDGGTSTDTTSTFDVNPLGISELNADMKEEVVGAVDDQGGNAEVTLTLEDEYGNAAGYQANAQDTTVNITTDSGTEVYSQTISSGSLTATTSAPDQALRTIKLGTDASTSPLDPDSDLSDTVETGPTTLNVDNNDASSVATDSLTIVHEAYDLNKGFQRVSLPQPAEVVTTDVNHVTTWNTSATNYDSDEIDVVTGDTVSGDAELHSGLQVSGSSADARIGFNFSTEDTAEPGEASLEEGWNFVGTNYDIATNNNYNLADDLLSVKDIAKDGSANKFVMDGGMNVLLDAGESSDSTTSLTDAINAGSSGNGEYGTYWVYVEDPSGSEYTRQIVKTGYDPSSRSP
ncbi:beta strand repeat-containing protein [Halobellus sp. GM3]|uniref:beta strand repeat-containing protein n=1 Tax=Halobellus sp. GM3 TaxID=3458410 RepID=UPI00403E1C9A